MPRGFLVKRTNHGGAASYRERKNSEGERLDLEADITRFGSPDSGYCASPTNFSKDIENNNYEKPHCSPLTVSTQLYFSNFEKLSVNSPSNGNSSPKSLDQSSPNKRRNENKNKPIKKPKAARKINFDEDTTSPVSGCIIKHLSPEEEGTVIYHGDIDSTYNFVEATPEARAELEKIDNKIGDYICQLCKEFYEDAFQLAQHRCSRIVHVEYRCPECGKVFNCPANLASHRRWHKPRPPTISNRQSAPAKILPSNQNAVHSGNLNEAKQDNAMFLIPTDLSISSPTNLSISNSEGQFKCEICEKKFRRQAYLRKHRQTHSESAKIVRNDNSVRHEILRSNNTKELSSKEPLCREVVSPQNAFESLQTRVPDMYVCKYCESSFSSSPGLTRHINKCHPTENRQVILLQMPSSLPRHM
ncbi:insulinoma-associated protein 1a-like [Saccostrea echinata]|uniref:insulinoma-associated protein 1a-like n=1 Tax=Saccostrea echinata TaxID=191078 RepID=UPI002A828A89|nr:insulinoma-associated protein 1a-like [Saccostrea echinata]